MLSSASSVDSCIVENVHQIEDTFELFRFPIEAVLVLLVFLSLSRCFLRHISLGITGSAILGYQLFLPSVTVPLIVAIKYHQQAGLKCIELKYLTFRPSIWALHKVCSVERHDWRPGVNSQSFGHAPVSIVISVAQRCWMNNDTKLILEMRKHLFSFSLVLFKNTLDKSFLSLEHELQN